MRPRRHLGPDPFELGLRVRRPRVDTGPDAEGCLRGQRQAVEIPAGVQAREQGHQAGRVDLPDPVDGRVVAQHRRVPGLTDDTADAERVRPEQVGLQRHDGLVPGRHRDDGLHPAVGLEVDRHAERVAVGPGVLR